MSKILADNISSRSGANITVTNNVNVTGIVTATSFSGDGSGLTNVSAWDSYDSWLFGSGG